MKVEGEGGKREREGRERGEVRKDFEISTPGKSRRTDEGKELNGKAFKPPQQEQNQDVQV